MRDQVQVERAVDLAAAPASAGQARRFVDTLLVDAGRGEWSDAAVLAVSELVTNALLHAHTPIRVTGRVLEDRVRVEVRDESPVLPLPRAYDEHATTGRGLELVASVTSEHGVESLGGRGKVVWFCVRDGVDEPEPTVDDLLAEWDETGEFTAADVPAASEPGAVAVQLRSMPATLWLAVQEHHDAMLRELALLQGGEAGPDSELAAADEARSLLDRAVGTAVQQARESGVAEVPLPQYHPGALPSVPPVMDLELQVPPHSGTAWARLQDVLDEGERLAAGGRLLVRPGLPEVVAVRDWACEQVIAQLGGTPPAPWPGADQERFTRDVSADPVPAGWDAERVTAATEGVIAVDETNRVVALSAPLSAVLGWPAEELVGRRVVAIVPPRFREAHVAGFTRHLSTGDARAIGVALRLPVLRADGTEVECDFRIESEPTPAGRVVYVASISPVEPEGPS